MPPGACDRACGTWWGVRASGPVRWWCRCLGWSAAPSFGPTACPAGAMCCAVCCAVVRAPCAGILACLDGYMNIAMEQTEVGRWWPRAVQGWDGRWRACKRVGQGLGRRGCHRQWQDAAGVATDTGGGATRWMEVWSQQIDKPNSGRQLWQCIRAPAALVAALHRQARRPTPYQPLTAGAGCHLPTSCCCSPHPMWPRPVVSPPFRPRTPAHTHRHPYARSHDAPSLCWAVLCRAAPCCAGVRERAAEEQVRGCLHQGQQRYGGGGGTRCGIYIYIHVGGWAAGGGGMMGAVDVGACAFGGGEQEAALGRATMVAGQGTAPPGQGGSGRGRPSVVWRMGDRAVVQCNGPCRFMCAAPVLCGLVG